MKLKDKIIGSMTCLIWIAGASPKCFAVWPPSTSLDQPAASGSTSSEMEREAFRRSHPPVERLEVDTHRLEEVVKDLKEDSRDLHKVSETTEPQNPRHL